VALGLSAVLLRPVNPGVVSNNPDRRLCVRRVLHDSLAQLDDPASGGKSSWMLNVLHVEHAKALVSMLSNIWDNAATGAVNELVGSLMRSESVSFHSLHFVSLMCYAGTLTLTHEGFWAPLLCTIQWIMVAKAQSDSIARRAALPTESLPRLLLCSGLRRASLLIMIDRLGRLGDADTQKGAADLRVLDPSASSEWSIGLP
jgi:hypothetical protein